MEDNFSENDGTWWKGKGTGTLTLDSISEKLSKDNRLYRIEVHQQQNIESPRKYFKWSKDNASICAEATTDDGKAFTLKNYTASMKNAFMDAAWLELFIPGETGKSEGFWYMLNGDSFNSDTGILSFTPNDSWELEIFKQTQLKEIKIIVRRWDGFSNLADIDPDPDKELFKIPDVASFSFSPAEFFRHGDYWLLQTRNGKIVNWKDLPEGVEHHFAALGVVGSSILGNNSEESRSVESLSVSFPPLSSPDFSTDSDLTVGGNLIVKGILNLVPPISAPVISGFTPSEASHGSALTIFGGSFHTTLPGNIAKLNGVPARVVAATATQLTVIVPKNMGCSGKITVETERGTATSPTEFSYVPTYTVTTIAGNGTVGNADGAGTDARFNLPRYITIDESGTLYVSDTYNHRIRTITPNANGYTVATLAGSTAGFADDNATGTSARFNRPVGIARDPLGNLYVADYDNHSIRKITPTGGVSTLAGYNGTVDKPQAGYLDAKGNAARFSLPHGVTIDARGNLYVTDASNMRIRKVTAGGVVTTLAGTSVFGYADGVEKTGYNLPPPTEGSAVACFSAFCGIRGITIDASNTALFVPESSGSRIRRLGMAPDRTYVTTLAGSGIPGLVDGTGSAAYFNSPYDAVMDTSGNLYVTDQLNHCIRKITPTGIVSTIAGSTQGHRDGLGSAAQFDNPCGITIDADDNLYVTDQSSIRKIEIEAPIRTGTYMVSTLAGSGPTGMAKDANAQYADGPGTRALFYHPDDIAIDKDGNIYMAEWLNHRIRKITPQGDVFTFAGTGAAGFLNHATGTSAQFENPSSIAIDENNNLYVADFTNHCIRKITPQGDVSTFAGTAQTSGYLDHTTGTSALFYSPHSIIIDKDNNLYVSDFYNRRIRKITPQGAVSTLAGIGPSGPDTIGGYEDGPKEVAAFDTPVGIAIDTNGNLYVADRSNHRIRKVTPQGDVSTFAGIGPTGTNNGGYADGDRSVARLNFPHGITIDAENNLYVGDRANHRIRKITPDGEVTTLAGNALEAGTRQNTGGYFDSIGRSAWFNEPCGVAINEKEGILYVADGANHRLRKMVLNK
ncbi:MAG: SMP-30/gluconolactonase/LRE family protein [Betaproteobacteria bacterium]|nr:SMP-30/gluconolactonase/LRE family protein [Betaproteobacteria bacterium]